MTQHSAHKGSIFIFALIISAVVMTVTTSFFNYFGSAVQSERVALAATQARALAEAGIDKAIYELNNTAGYTGETDTALGNGSFSVSIASIDGSNKRLTAIGYVPNSANPTATKEIQVTAGINASVVSFRYGVQVGEDGITMSNGSRIEGNIFSNGNISGSGTITGDATVAVSADPAADQQSTVQNSGFKVGDTSAHAGVAQSFKPSASASLAKITLNLKKAGSPGDLTIKIVTDNNGKPSTTVLASGTIPASIVTSAYSFADVTLASTPSVTANQTYWIIAVASAVSSSNYFTWGLDTNSGYSRGAAKSSSNWNAQNPSWSSITGDLDFMTYLVGVATALSGVTVGGNAWAYALSGCSVGGTASYQTISACNITGTKYPGTAPTAPVPFPISDAQITDWEAVAAAGGTIAGPYTPTGAITLGPKKIDGNLTITNGASLTLAGPVWVNGNVTFSNNATLNVSSSIGASGAIIIADAIGNTANAGKVTLSNNVIVDGNGNANSLPMIITTNTSSPHAITVANNADSIILYAPYGSVEISNGASANQVTAKELEMENNSTVTYMSGLQNMSFSNGSGGSWAVIPGTYAIVR